MLLNAVIFILRETLEAALVISVLLAIAAQFRKNTRWLIAGISAGVFGAYLYAANMKQLSAWFDYSGQEIVNAALHGAIVVLITVHVAALVMRLLRDRADQAGLAAGHRCYPIYWASAASIVGLAVVREGSEIFLYLGRFYPQSPEGLAVVLGSGIGFGIGLSTGVILYYGLLGLSRRGKLAVSVTLLALFAGNMAAQSSLQLTQADWIPHTQALWDSSRFVSEHSVLGHILYAMFGYEATPSFIQVMSYLAGVVVVATSICMSWFFNGRADNCANGRASAGQAGTGR